MSFFTRFWRKSAPAPLPQPGPGEKLVIFGELGMH
jgi:hypothetical protein